MTLPLPLQQAVELLLNLHSLSPLIQARKELTSRYRTAYATQFIETEAQRYAYIASRMPATYAAVQAVLKAVLKRLPHLNVESALDLGTGPGTALWALKSCLPCLSIYHLIEQDDGLIQLGKKLIELSKVSYFEKTTWQKENFAQLASFSLHDLVIFSYSLGEIDSSLLSSVLVKAWQATQHLLIIIEPGTPAGFERIHSIRQQLIALDAHLVAPCPHYLPCPLADVKGEWCHFTTQVQRSVTHKLLKGACLGHEEEKFCYLAVTKNKCPLPESRLISYPKKHSGHVSLKLCKEGKIQWVNFSRKQGDLYRQAKKAEWGDDF